jgi:thiol-disulfide isomerase/thioredoxin
MQTKLSTLPEMMPILIFSFIAVWLAWLGTAIFQKAQADEITYQEPIDYWKANKAPKVPVVKNAPELKVPEIGQKSTFEWQKFLNPQNKEFFKEGDYTPPEPFMEIVRNPTDENLKLWFSYINMKNKLFERLESRIQEYSGSPKESFNEDDKTKLIKKLKVASKVHPDVKRFRFRFYFDSSCPHCHRMMGTLSDLQAQGFLIEAKQVDKKPISPTLMPFPSEYATSEELKEKNITSVPVLLIGDLEKKQVYRITGYQSTDTILSQLQTF